MNRHRLLALLASLMFFIFIADYLARIFYWYYSISYFDMPMHFLGGLWVGFFFIYVLSTKTQPSFLKIILWVLLIGLAWELFEFVVKNNIGGAPFDTLDTLSDLFLDVVGGLIAFFLCRKMAMPTYKKLI